MPNPVFPTTLPNVVTTRYSFTPRQTAIRTEFESGYARIRRKTLTTPYDMSVAWLFTPGELAIFEKFYEDDIFSGAGWFDIPMFSGLGQGIYTARFKEPYKVSAAAKEHLWAVTAELEVVLWKTLTDVEMAQYIASLQT